MLLSFLVRFVYASSITQCSFFYKVLKVYSKTKSKSDIKLSEPEPRTVMILTQSIKPNAVVKFNGPSSVILNLINL